MTSEPLAPGAHAIYLNRQSECHETWSKHVQSNYFRIKILTPEGRSYGNIVIPYVKGFSDVSAFKARTIGPDGTVKEISPELYDQLIEKLPGVKIQAKTVSIPDLQPGSILEYRYNLGLEGDCAWGAVWDISSNLFTRKADFSLKSDGRLNVRWSWPAGLPPGTQPPKQDPDHFIRMTVNNAPAFVKEEMMPPENEMKMRVEFWLAFFALDRDFEKFWKEQTQLHQTWLDEFLKKPKAVERALEEIVSPGDSREVKLRKIYARVQQFENLSYADATTREQEKREKQDINNVETVWKKGFGWERDLNWLFLALARQAGFEAYDVLASNHANFYFNPARMNTRELRDHVVLIKIDGKDRYFDPGIPFCPFGFLPWPLAGSTGRKVDPDGGSWVTTETKPSSESRTVRKGRLSLQEDGSLTGRVTVTFSGIEALNLRLSQMKQDAVHRKELLENDLKADLLGTPEVSLKNTPAWDRTEEPLVAEFEVKLSGLASQAGHITALPVGLFGGREKHLFEHTARNYPVSFPFFRQWDDTITIEPLPGQTSTALPKPTDLNTPVIQYVVTATADASNQVTLHRLLRNDLTLVPKEKYSPLRDFYERVRTGDDQQIVLSSSSASSPAQD